MAATEFMPARPRPAILAHTRSRWTAVGLLLCRAGLRDLHRVLSVYRSADQLRRGMARLLDESVYAHENGEL